MSYSIRYNRATNHIAGIAAKCTSTGEERGGVVAAYAENACGVLTRGRLAQGKSYEALQDALDAARITGGRKVCKSCEKAALAALEAAQAYDSLADQELSDDAEVVAQMVAERETVEGAEHQVGDRLYFIPSKERQYPAFIPADEVVVKKVVDHGQATAYSPRFTYVVQLVDVPTATQGTDATELHKIGEVPVDHRFEWTYKTAICADCRQPVTYANTKIVSEPIQREGKAYHGMATTAERRVCAKH